MNTAKEHLCRIHDKYNFRDSFVALRFQTEATTLHMLYEKPENIPAGILSSAAIPFFVRHCLPAMNKYSLLSAPLP
jgi:2-iminoacetate synthase ThiH